MPKKTFIVTAIIIIILLSFSNVYLFKSNRDLKNLLEGKGIEGELKKRVSVERGKIEKDLDEKHRADIVSYRAMAKRLEAERQKTQQLQETIQSLKAK